MSDEDLIRRGGIAPAVNKAMVESRDIRDAICALPAVTLPDDVAKVVEEAGKVLEGVTPGPWRLSSLADYTPHSIQASYGCINGLSAWFTLAHINVPDESEVGMTDGAFSPEVADANARFIAWCREGVPALTATITAQAAQIERLRQAMTDADNDVILAHQAREAAETALSAMTKERDTWEAAAKNHAEWQNQREAELAAERAKVARLVEAGKFLAWMQKSGHPVAEAKEAWAKLSAAMSEAEARDERR